MANTQNEPVQDGHNDASVGDKVQGIVNQIAGDVALRPEENIDRLLRARLADAGIELDDEEITALVARLRP
ncbi:hypothetical protein [Glaciihabitans sp. UYNi722]|uniref:hypothetical protein n=1 Tax=Glaciihabitans sp. UYNi722 TaxID=3156344 RepID=UPI0033981D7B